ncbi:pseudouridine synthase, partial [Genlisea aurea]
RDPNMNPKRLQRYLVAIEYVGTQFAGAQKQPAARTVVGVLEEAFQKFIGQPVSIYCSSRTDAGVHALSNVCHVDVERITERKPGEVLPPHDPLIVKRAVNHFLQQKNEGGDIMVIDVRCVPNDFHARYNALERTYFYRLVSGKDAVSSFDKDRVWQVPEELDLSSMKKACEILVGCHDFSSFRSAGCQAKSPVRTLEELSVSAISSSPFPEINNPSRGTSERIEDCGECFGIRKRNHNFLITARARSFLYHQVRLVVGVVKSVGSGELTVSDVERILKARSITAASPMAPASGLYLAHVKYDFFP